MSSTLACHLQFYPLYVNPPYPPTLHVEPKRRPSDINEQYKYITSLSLLMPYMMYFYYEKNMKHVSNRLKEINDFDLILTSDI